MPEVTSIAAVARERDVRAALRSDPGTKALADAPLTVQPGGLSNHAWVADGWGEKFFIRLSPPDAVRLGVDRASECRLLGLVAHAGLAPEVIRCDPSRRLLVTRYIEGHALARVEATVPANVERVGRALRQLHALPVASGMRRVDFAAQARHLEAQRVVSTPVSRQLRTRARAAFGTLSAAGRRDTICHNDLHHLNLVEGGNRLWLVDWEYGGAGDPAFDIASFVCQHDCGQREREQLLEAYGDGLSAEQLQAACWAFDYVQWLWYRMWPTGEGADTVYAERAAALERRLRTPHPP
jgi:thiamine kinase-like enzyme